MCDRLTRLEQRVDELYAERRTGDPQPNPIRDGYFGDPCRPIPYQPTHGFKKWDIAHHPLQGCPAVITSAVGDFIMFSNGLMAYPGFIGLRLAIPQDPGYQDAIDLRNELIKKEGAYGEVELKVGDIAWSIYLGTCFEVLGTKNEWVTYKEGVACRHASGLRPAAKSDPGYAEAVEAKAKRERMKLPLEFNMACECTPEQASELADISGHPYPPYRNLKSVVWYERNGGWLYIFSRSRLSMCGSYTWLPFDEFKARLIVTMKERNKGECCPEMQWRVGNAVSELKDCYNMERALSMLDVVFDRVRAGERTNAISDIRAIKAHLKKMWGMP